MAYTLTREPLSWFKRVANIRTAKRSEDSRRQMWESLKVRQLHPLLCRSDGTVVDGHLRLDSACLGEITHLDVIITDESLTPAQISEIQFLSAFFREDIIAYDRWQAVKGIWAAHPDRSAKDVADQLNIDPSMVTRLLSPSKCIEAAQNALRDGKIGISMCYTLSKCQTEAEQAAMLAAALSGASRDQLEQAGRKTRSGKADSNPHPRVPKIKIPLAISTDDVSVNGTVTVAGVAGGEIDLEDAENILKEAMKAIKEAQKKGWTVKSAMSAWKDTAAVCTDKAKAGNRQ